MAIHYALYENKLTVPFVHLYQRDNIDRRQLSLPVGPSSKTLPDNIFVVRDRE